MNAAALLTEVKAILKSIAPEVDADALRTDLPLRDQVDLDSMDWLNFLIALHERLHVDIPESDYARLTTLDALTGYLSAKSGCAGTPPL